MEIPNGDGTGLGWYEHRAAPALFRSITPAWGDENLVELATEIRTRLFLAHVRAGTGTPVQQTNCHPFRYRNWRSGEHRFGVVVPPGAYLRSHR